MDLEEFRASLNDPEPPPGTPAVLAALWWDAKGDWEQAHGLVDELESRDAMAVHAYLHRKQGDAANADYWYRRSYLHCYRPDPEEEWQALVNALTQQIA